MMTEPADNAARRHLMTLCHQDDCCPEIFYVEASPVDTCLEVIDDFGNHAFFGPDTLLQTELKPMGDPSQPDLWLLRDGFGDEVYMQLGQYGEMLSDVNCALIREVAAVRGVGIHDLITQARARLSTATSV
jgi:hypothetical protein